MQISGFDHKKSICFRQRDFSRMFWVHVCHSLDVVTCPKLNVNDFDSTILLFALSNPVENPQIKHINYTYTMQKSRIGEKFPLELILLRHR